MEDLVKQLEQDWDHGFFYKLRQGYYDPSEGEVLISKYKKLLNFDEPAFPRRVVSLTWYIPLFLEWQLERVESMGGDLEAYEKFRNTMLSLLEEVFGVP